MNLEIRESQIEDIFATQLDEVKSILSIQDSISLISRQKILPSGNKLDLLFLSSTELLLLELKAVRSEIKFCKQVISYKDELLELQENNKLPKLPIKVYLVCPDFLEKHKIFCCQNYVIPIQFSPYNLLKNYYFKVKAVTKFINLKPSNHGLWNLHLLNRIIYSLENKQSIENLVQNTDLSRSTVGSYLRLSNELGLTIRKPLVELTNLGFKYFEKKDPLKPIDFISDEQIEILKDHITQNPFYSPATFGIYSAVEAIFSLSKNYYPVPLKEATKYFTILSGKINEWQPKAANDAFIMYSNYGIDLGLLAKLGREYYITPSGIKFMLLLELNKAIIFVNSI
ncbi:MAG: hypothetical protein Q7J65_00950 [Candidatus Marinimicrobia bacterium]|nr:hypothetical protein [Candidatus Neomarinimicrobiota bacterium]